MSNTTHSLKAFLILMKNKYLQNTYCKMTRQNIFCDQIFYDSIPIVTLSSLEAVNSRTWRCKAS